MPRWKALPQELDPEVRELADALRMLVDRGGAGVAAVADSTGYSRTSWERYLNGRLLPPKGAVIALAEVAGVDPLHLTTLWELAERAWSRAEMRHDLTIEATRIAQAREGLEEFAAPTAHPSPQPSSTRRSSPHRSSTHPSAPAATGPATGPASGPEPASPRTASGAAAPANRPAAPANRPAAPAHRALTFLAGTVGALLIVGAAVFLTQADPEDESRAADRAGSSAPAAAEAPLPDGVKCQGVRCAGEDPEAMGCGGQRAVTGRSVRVGAAVLEVRFSEVCGAAWARVTGAAAGDRVTVAADGGPRRKAEVGQDPDAYTPMVAVRRAQDAKACVAPAKGRARCTG